MDPTLARIDRFCDAVPRQWADATDLGPLRLFARRNGGMPFYARPIPGGPAATAAAVDRVRSAQRELGFPEAFEWIVAAAPTMHDAAETSGLHALICPVLVLDGTPARAPFPPGYTSRLLGPADGDLAAAARTHIRVAATAFGVPAGAAPSPAGLAELAADLAAGRVARLLVTGPDGPAAAGSAQRAGDTVELVGIGVAAEHRGRGLGAAVTAGLATAARAAGARLVFLAAGDEGATRVYERVGFRRVGECGIAEP